MKQKLKIHLSDRVLHSDNECRLLAISNDVYLDAILYVLLEGVTSDLVGASTNQNWIDRSTILIQLHKSTSIDESAYYIDSTDIQSLRVNDKPRNNNKMAISMMSVNNMT
jgi:hypothetical protein